MRKATNLYSFFQFSIFQDLEALPFDRCDELVVDDATLDPGPQVRSKARRPEFVQRQLDRLQKLVAEAAGKSGLRSMVALVRCSMTRDQFVEMINSMCIIHGFQIYGR